MCCAAPTVSGTEPERLRTGHGRHTLRGHPRGHLPRPAAPTEGGYTQEDLTAIGSLFDDHLHPIDVNAFGDETDVNGDGLVLVLLTDRVTRLAGCGGGSVVVGLFFAVDLFEDLVGSNNAEIFYGLTPDAECGVDRDYAISRLPGVFIHEFQHMINYGQQVIQRDGDAEDTWLDEGLSGFAEELGARLVPDDRCLANDCLTQFQGDNFSNAYNYLSQQESAYLIGPGGPRCRSLSTARPGCSCAGSRITSRRSRPWAPISPARWCRPPARAPRTSRASPECPSTG